MILTIKERGVLTVTKEIRRELGISPGDTLDAKIDKGRLILTPVSIIPRTLELSDSGKRKEEQADSDLRRGRVKKFAGAKELIRELDENRKNR